MTLQEKRDVWRPVDNQRLPDEPPITYLRLETAWSETQFGLLWLVGVVTHTASRLIGVLGTEHDQIV